MIYHIAARTEQGPIRERNEDHIAIGGWIKNRGWLSLTVSADDEQIVSSGLLLAVADGMGGYAGGQTASRLALEALGTSLSRATPAEDSAAIVAEDLSAALRQANAAVLDASDQAPKLAAMGTTLSAVLLTGNAYWLLHAGDSRILRIRNRFVRPLTRDDNLAERLIAQGLDAESAAANPEAASLTNWIGYEEMRPIVTRGDAPEHGDQLILCSDGLYGFVPEDAMVDALNDPTRSLQDSVDSLVEQAIAAGSTDNISLIVIRVDDPIKAREEDNHDGQ